MKPTWASLSEDERQSLLSLRSCPAMRTQWRTDRPHAALRDLGLVEETRRGAGCCRRVMAALTPEGKAVADEGREVLAQRGREGGR